ncbi:hypothetical protein [Streptomyces albogriseolus]|uniref:hypothetical protein n=1 Tax=Streptomyces albogriseolus TaxID=1887 RepID=UPI0037B96417
MSRTTAKEDETSGDLGRVEKVLGLEFRDTIIGGYIFGLPRDSKPLVGVEYFISEAAFNECLDASNRGAQRMVDHEGWLDPEQGFAEFEMSQMAINPLTRKASEFQFDFHPCGHPHEFEPPTWIDQVNNFITPVARVTSPDRSTCIEISPNTALCPVPLDGRTGRRPTDSEKVRRSATLKIFVHPPTTAQDLTRRSRELANSFLFELSTRNRTHFALRPKLSRLVPKQSYGPMNYNVRFPRSVVPDNVSALFSMPMSISARGNTTLSFLYYYQVLEHYFPTIHKREAIKKIRRIIRSLDFNEGEDQSILKILNSAERTKGESDGDQLRALLEYCVSEEKLKQFFTLQGDAHFGSKGPIQGGVRPILTKGKDLPPLHSQVASRVYQIRNRIVHAKDDSRFEESKVLLPLSQEAMALRPDVDLVRLLATEVICNGR